MSNVLFGIDQVLATPRLLNGRLGLVTNDAARTALDATFRNRVALQKAGFKLIRLFSPEHGLGASAADGATVQDGFDAVTGLPVVSLYGEQMCPPRKTLTDLDTVVFDLPDIGARFYTYIWTLSHVLEACADAGVPLVVLDRPNPLGGELSATEGPILDVARFGSFVGRATIPIRHSLTVGELAQLWNAERARGFQAPVAADVSPLHPQREQSGLTSAATGIGELEIPPANLQVVPCSGWTRAMHWSDTGLPFVQTSPAIASYAAALTYPGVCLFEATNLSLGRGTPLSFQVVGAPWLKAAKTAQVFNALELPGVRAAATTFTPALPPHAGEACPAVRLGVAEPHAFQPVRAGLHLLAVTLALHRAEFCWASYPTAANPSGAGHFERLIGQAGIREALEENPADLVERVLEWTATPDWRERVEGCLIYA